MTIVLTRNSSDVESVRSLFISDIHLGAVHSRGEHLIQLLNRIRPRYLYIVGDLIDEWELRRRWYWKPHDTQVLRMLARLARSETCVRYVVGNHDDFLRGGTERTSLISSGVIEIADEFVHETADQRQFLIVHGDQFDDFGCLSESLEQLAAAVYSLLLSGNRVWFRLFGGSRRAISTCFRLFSQTFSRHVRRFRSRLIQHALGRRFDGVICGHVHFPQHQIQDGMEYLNSGDWLEHCSFITENSQGNFTLHHADVSELMRDAAPSDNLTPARRPKFSKAA